ncbi:MAG: hypothetical protein HY056_02050 [Proteobacteria bacterium]|nr:hypothetical protein [Pseudomonadota bacterium]
MKISTKAAVLAISGLAVVVTALPADASPKKRRLAVEQPTRTIYYTPAGRRVVVTGRSYLDAGTDVLPGERKYSDYALPPYYTTYSRNDPKISWNRMPFPDCFDLGIFCR